MRSELWATDVERYKHGESESLFLILFACARHGNNQVNPLVAVRCPLLHI